MAAKGSADSGKSREELEAELKSREEELICRQGFEGLEWRLRVDGNYQRYKDTLSEIRRSGRDGPQYAEMIRYLLTVNHHLQQNGHDCNAYVIGGYAVMAWLAEEFGTGVLQNWRGSHDIDIVARDPSVMSIIMASFDERLQRRSNSIPDKYSLTLKDKKTELADFVCDIDLYACWGNSFRVNHREICEDFFERGTQLKLFGIPVAVPSVVDLIKLKLDVKSYGDLRPKDRSDIVDLVSILAGKQSYATEPKKLYEQFSPEENNTLVRDVFNHTDRPAPTVIRLDSEALAHIAKKAETFMMAYSVYHQHKGF